LKLLLQISQCPLLQLALLLEQGCVLREHVAVLLAHIHKFFNLVISLLELVLVGFDLAFKLAQLGIEFIIFVNALRL
jgi:hypothetical protein